MDSVHGAIKQEFSAIFGADGKQHVVRAPGRVNLIGEHVDYLGGRVLPCAIDRFTTSSGAPAQAWEVVSPVPDGLPYVRAQITNYSGTPAWVDSWAGA